MEGDVHGIIDALDTTDRLILLMHWGDGCTVAEITAILDIDARAVAASLERVRSAARSWRHAATPIAS